MKMKVYLAAPFFNDEQRAVCASIEAALGEVVDLYSPRKDGVLTEMKTAAERRQAAPRIFRKNIEKIEWADCVLAVIDDRDAGVMFEVGYAYAWRTSVITFTAKDYGVNLMIQGAARAHVKTIEGLVDVFSSNLKPSILVKHPVAEAVS